MHVAVRTVHTAMFRGGETEGLFQKNEINIFLQMLLQSLSDRVVRKVFKCPINKRFHFLNGVVDFVWWLQEGCCHIGT